MTHKPSDPISRPTRPIPAEDERLLRVKRLHRVRGSKMSGVVEMLKAIKHGKHWNGGKPA